MVGAPSFSITLPVHAHTFPIKNPFVYFSQFSLPYILKKPFLHSPPTLPFSIFHPFFACLFLHTVIPTVPTKLFPLPFSQFRLHHGPLNNCVLTLMGETFTSLTVPQAWIRIVTITVINSLFLRLIKLVYCM